MCDDVIHPSRVNDHQLTHYTWGLFVTATAEAAAIAGDRSKRPATEQDIVIKTADGTCDAVLPRPSDRGQRPAMLVRPDVRSRRLVSRDLDRRLVAQAVLRGQTYDVAQAERARAALTSFCTTARA